MTPIEAKKLVATLLAAFPRDASFLSEEQALATASAYRASLEDLDSQRAAAAVTRLCATSERLPSIAAIRRAALEQAEGVARAGGEAWGDVLAAIRRYGTYRVPGKDFAFQDPLVARAVDALGWRDMCASENGVADRARFIELYEGLVDRRRAEGVTASLPGASAPRQIGGSTPLTSVLKQIFANIEQRVLEAGDDQEGG
jgi:hypothetical protein